MSDNKAHQFSPNPPPDIAEKNCLFLELVPDIEQYMCLFALESGTEVKGLQCYKALIFCQHIVIKWNLSKVN